MTSLRRKNFPFSSVEAIVGRENTLRAHEDCFTYSFDASRLQSCPHCVAFPGSVEEIAELLRLANRERFPVTPRGAGSGMVGAAIPTSGGLVMVTGRLNRLLELDPDNMLAVVEPGLITGEFQRLVQQEGLFYPPDPASLSFSSLGGNVAMCSGGPRAVKYGVTRDYVLGLEVVLPTGAIVRTGTRTVKGVVGYDLTRLLVGSEGTLGVFTKITLRLIPAPEKVRTLLAVFPQMDGAAQAVCDIIRNRIIPSTIEFMDRTSIEAVENHMRLGLPTHCEAILLLEVDGRDMVLDDEAGRIREIALRWGASQVDVAGSQEEREQLWKARRSISPALGQIRPGKINEDVTVLRTQIPALIRFVQDLARKYELIIANFGHAGDGNIHVNIMLDRKDEGEVRRAEEAVEELFRFVLSLGGTISGEHGIGITKSPFFPWEVGTEGMEAMWHIKKALDPLNVLNPGKMFISDRSFFSPSSG